MSVTPKATWFTPSARGRSRQRTPEARPLDQLELRPPRVGDVRDVERDAGRRHVGARSAPSATAQPAATSASCAPPATPRTCRQISHTPTSPQAWPAGTGGGPSPSSTCTSLTRPGRSASRRSISSIATRAAGARPAIASSPGSVAGVVEQHAVEADVPAVELDRRVDVADADADVVDAHERRHAASTGCAEQPGSRRGSRACRRRLASSVDRQARRPHLAAGLAEHLHQRLELALVGAELAAPAAGQPELREELVGAPRVLARGLDRRRARPPPRTPASRRAPERAAADEAVAAVLEQEARARRRS
mgnify:CR=1 FL=1